MLSWYSVALFAHIVGVLILFISMALQWLSTLRLRRAVSAMQVREWAGLVGGLRGLTPVSGVLILGAGAYLAVTGWSLLEPWILASLAAMVVMMVFSMGIVGRSIGVIRRAAGDVTTQEIPAALRARIDAPALWVATQMAMAVALSIVFMMTTKPGLPLAIVVVIVALALGGVAGGLSAKPRRASQSMTPAAPVESASRL